MIQDVHSRSISTTWTRAVIGLICKPKRKPCAVAQHNVAGIRGAIRIKRNDRFSGGAKFSETGASVCALTSGISSPGSLKFNGDPRIEFAFAAGNVIRWQKSSRPFSVTRFSTK